MAPQSDADRTAGEAAQARTPPQHANRQSLGKYQIQRALGTGGMGTVFLAFDSQLKRTVALKILSRDKARNPVLAERFKREAESAARLHHPNIVQIYEAGEADGYLYLALEYVKGKDAYEIVRQRGPIPVKRTIRIVEQVAQALDHIHGQNIVHRDIKPSNLLITRDGTVKVTDLGLARSLDEESDAGITRMGTTVGTVDYMPPEQARDSKAADIRSDLYSLGCTWYQMLTGKPPFATGDLTNKLNAHAHEAPPDPRDENDTVPEGIVGVLHRLMAKSPDDRYQTPRELLEELANPHLTRETVASDVLAALAEDDSDDPPPPRTPLDLPAARTGARKPPRRRSTADTVSRRREPPDSDETPDEPSPSLAPRRDPATEPPRPPVPRRRATLGPTAASEDEPEVETSSDPVQPSATFMAAVDDDDSDVPDRRASRRAEASARKTRSRRRRPTAETGSGAPGVQLNVESLTVLIPIAIVAAIIGLLWWISTWFGADQAATSAADPGAPTAAEVAGPAADSAPSDDSADDDELPLVADLAEDVPPSATAPAGPGRAAALSPAFAAALEFRSGSPEERRHMPEWVGGGEGNAPLDGESRGLPVRTVGRTDGPPADFASLSEALADVPTAGCVIRLVGDGPFLLPPTRIQDCRELTITAAAGDRPLVVAVPGDGPVGAVLRLSGGVLSLRGVHLALLARQFPSSEEVALIEVAAGALALRGGSATLVGRRPGPTNAFRLVASAEQSPGRTERPQATPVLLERVVVRGEGLTAIVFDRVPSDLLAWNCLFATADGPILRSAPPFQSAGTDGGPLCALRFMSCTATTDRHAFEFRAPEADAGASSAVPPVSVLTLNSVFAASGASEPASLALLSGWPHEPDHEGGGPVARRMEWNVTASLFAGWESLTRSDDGRLLVSDENEWRRTWGGGPLKSHFVAPSRWPDPPPARLSAVEPANLDPARIAEAVRTAEGRPPGCDGSELSLPEPARLARAEALAERPVVPAGVNAAGDGSARGGGEGRAVEINLDRRGADLARTISGGDWPSGTEFVVTGSGSHRLNALRVRGKSFRLRFEPAEAEPLVLDVRPDDYRNNDGAVIAVEDGSIEIEGARVRLPASNRGQGCFLNVVGGSFALRNCTIEGPVVASPGFDSVVRWSGGGPHAGSDRPPGAFPQLGLVSRTYVAGHGTLLKARMSGGAFVAEDSLLVTLGDLLEIDVAEDAPAIPGAVDLRQCTLSAAGAFFRVRSGPGADRPDNGGRLRFFVDRTLFAPAIESRRGRHRQVLLSIDGAAAGGHRVIDWWEDSNGYAPELAVFLHDAAEASPQPQRFQDHWLGAWGPHRVLRPLTDPGGVLLRDSLPDASRLTPSAFTLHATAKAQRWSVEGRPIGADPQTFASSSAEETPPDRPPATPSTTPF